MRRLRDFASVQCLFCEEISKASDMDLHFTVPAFNLKSLLFYTGVGITSLYVVGLGLGIGLQTIAVFGNIFKAVKAVSRRKKWDKLGKDKVVLHHFMRGVVTPSPSPFALKLETYLRMAKIPYVNDFHSFYTPELRKPWITVNGEDIFESQPCVEFLAGKYQKDFTSHLSPVEQATARAFQTMCEEHLYWALSLWRFVYTEGFTVPLLSPLMPTIFNSLLKWIWNTMATEQGMGRHTKEEVTEMAVEDLRSLSLYLGSKPYFTGDKPTEVDCAMFGTLAEIVWTTPNSFMEKIVNGELVNLKQFCEKMKAEFWPDWNECLFASHFRDPKFDPSEISDSYCE